MQYHTWSLLYIKNHALLFIIHALLDGLKVLYWIVKFPFYWNIAWFGLIQVVFDQNFVNVG